MWDACNMKKSCLSNARPCPELSGAYRLSRILAHILSISCWLAFLQCINKMKTTYISILTFALYLHYMNHINCHCNHSAIMTLRQCGVLRHNKTVCYQLLACYVNWSFKMQFSPIVHKTRLLVLKMTRKWLKNNFI